MNKTKNIFNSYLIKTYPYPHERRKSLLNWFIRYLDQNSDYHDMQSQIKDILNQGCVSGCIGELIYTYDCKKFYQKYQQCIWDIVYEYLQSTGFSLGQFIDAFRDKIEDEDSFKVNMAWFAVEQTAWQLDNLLEEYHYEQCA